MTERHDEESVIARSALLISTLSAAADVVRGMAERRRGVDPVSQEDPKIARAFLRQATSELEGNIVTLNAGRVLQDETAPARSVRLARRLNELLLFNQISRLVHLMHQRLMSLYPEVPEGLVEEARMLEVACMSLGDAEDGGDAAAFIRDARQFLESLRSAL